MFPGPEEPDRYREHDAGEIHHERFQKDRARSAIAEPVARDQRDCHQRECSGLQDRPHAVLGLRYAKRIKCSMM